MNAHTPFDANQDWTNPYCQNSSNDPMVDALLGNAYHVVRTVYCNLGNLKLIYDFLNQYGMVLGVQSEAELKALTTEAKYARIYGFSRVGDRQVTDYLYVEGDRTGILPNDTTATGSWITVATSGSGGGSGGISSGGGAYIPWVYSNGYATGGETSINVPDGTVGVPFIIVNGDMQYVGRGFEFNVDNLSVTLAQPLEEGDEVVFLLTGVPAVPDNPNVNDWIQINWLYNNGVAVGGEQVIAIPYTFQSIPAVYKNGLRLYKGLTTESYTADPDNQRLFLTEPLATNDRLIVQIGGEARVLEVADHTLQEVARSTNVKDSEVILSTDSTQFLNDKKIVYSVSEQKAYGLPVLPTNVFIQSVDNGKLTYSPGSIEVDLIPVPNSAESLKRELSSENGASLIGGLDKFTGVFDIASLSGADDSDKLNAAFAYCHANNLKLVSSESKTFDVAADVTAYGNFDLSNCVFNLSGGKVDYVDERDAVDYIKQITLTGFPLNEMSTTLTTSDSLVGWDNSLVKITSTEVDLYRYLNGVYSDKLKGEVNFHSKGGALLYTLKNTYTSAATCTLYKSPTKRNVIYLPTFAGSVNRWAFNVRRSLVDVHVVTGSSVTVPVDNNVLASSECFGVNWFITAPGVNQPDNNSRYNFSSEFILKHTFTGGIIGAGWRSIDGNFNRDMTIRDMNVDSIHFHYGCSKILVDNCKVKGGILVGTGAFGESTQIVNSDIYTAGIRTDYGEHKGDFIIRGGSMRIPSNATGIVDLFLCRSDNVLASGNPLQPRSLYLPSNIIISTNIYWPDAVTLNLVSFKNAFKTSSTRNFIMPKAIDFSGSTFNGTNARFEYAISYHDTNRPLPVFNLTPISSQGCLLTAYIGYQAEMASCLYGVVSNMDIDIKNNLSGSTRSYFKQVGGIIRHLRGYSGGTTYMLGRVTIDKAIVDWSTDNNFVAGFFSVTNTILDGTKAKAAAGGTKPVVNTYVHVSTGNTAYEMVATDSRDVVDKKVLLCSREGAAGNWSGAEIVVNY